MHCDRWRCFAETKSSFAMWTWNWVVFFPGWQAPTFFWQEWVNSLSISLHSNHYGNWTLACVVMPLGHHLGLMHKSRVKCCFISRITVTCLGGWLVIVSYLSQLQCTHFTTASINFQITALITSLQCLKPFHIKTVPWRSSNMNAQPTRYLFYPSDSGKPGTSDDSRIRHMIYCSLSPCEGSL